MPMNDADRERYFKERKRIAEEMEANEQFCALRDQYRDASAGYRDGKKAQKAVIDYALALLDAKGQPAGSESEEE